MDDGVSSEQLLGGIAGAVAFEVGEAHPEAGAGGAAPKAQRRARWWARALVPECVGPGRAGSLGSLAGGPEAAAAAKLLVVMFGGIGVARLVICDALELSCNRGYGLRLFLVQDMHKVVLDLAFVFLVGRIGCPSSPLAVDSAAFLAALGAGVAGPQMLDQLPFMKVSISLYTIMCTWTALTFLGVATVLTLVIGAAALHVHHLCVTVGSSERLQFVSEAFVVGAVFVAPRVAEPGFHFHHWFSSWLGALFCRWPTLWSRALQAFLLGVYANGVAVYGRDPVLACEAALMSARHLSCHWLRACHHGHGNHSGNGSVPVSYTSPDWRTCTPGDYA